VHLAARQFNLQLPDWWHNDNLSCARSAVLVREKVSEILPLKQSNSVRRDVMTISGHVMHAVKSKRIEKAGRIENRLNSALVSASESCLAAASSSDVPAQKKTFPHRKRFESLLPRSGDNIAPCPAPAEPREETTERSTMPTWCRTDQPQCVLATRSYGKCSRAPAQRHVPPPRFFFRIFLLACHALHFQSNRLLRTSFVVAVNINVVPLLHRHSCGAAEYAETLSAATSKSWFQQSPKLSKSRRQLILVVVQTRAR
jgi:hypothetical protein